MGRFSDGGNYPKDIVKGALSKVLFYPNSRLSIIYKKILSISALSKVRQIRIADFIKGVVATRRWITDWTNLLCQHREVVPNKLHAIFANVVALQM